VFENRVLRRIIGPKSDEVIVARMGENRNAYKILARMPEGKRALERPICRWVDNIKMDPKEIQMGWYGLD
jgi:hypothetical protein